MAKDGKNGEGRRRKLSPVSRRAFLGTAAKAATAATAVAATPWVLMACDSGYSESGYSESAYSEYCNIAYCNACGKNYTAPSGTCYCNYSDYSEDC